MGADDRVGVCLANLPHYPLACFALWGLGAAGVGMNPLYSLRQLSGIAVDSGVRWVVTSDHPASIGKLRELAAQVGCRLIVCRADAADLAGGPPPDLCDGEVALSDLLEAAPARGWGEPEVEALAMIQYTGGTTPGARRVLVIGGGWLGLEVAAAIRQQGLEVTLAEAAPRLCARSAPSEVSEYLLELHRGHGVDVRLGACVQPVLGEDGLTLPPDAQPYDLAVVAVGIAARDELAVAAGLPTADGVLTDCNGATADPDIFAIGDVARLCASAAGPGLRLESWRHAETQARLAAAAIVGEPRDYDEPAWFWSDQFGRLIQIAGLPDPDLELMDAEAGEKPVWRYGRNGAVAAVIGVDRARDVRMAQRALPTLASRMAAANGRAS